MQYVKYDAPKRSRLKHYLKHDLGIRQVILNLSFLFSSSIMPKVIKALSIAEVKALASVVGDHSVGGVNGLRLRVFNRNGQLCPYWVLIRQGKNRLFYHIGAFPDIGLKEAREIASSVLLNGIPTKKKEAQEKANEDLTIEDVYVAFFEWKLARGDWKRGETKKRYEQNLFERHLLPTLKSVKVSSCTFDDVARAFKPIWVDHPSICNKAHQLILQLFSWATVVRKIRDSNLANPAFLDGIKPLLPAEKTRRKRYSHPFLMPSQIPDFFAQLVPLSTHSTVARMLICAILTCSRSANIRGMKWDQVNLEEGVWRIPESEMKISANGQHVVPLSTQVLDLIKVQKDFSCNAFVFSSKRSGSTLSKATMNYLINSMHKEEVENGREGWLDREQSEQLGEPVIPVQHAISRASFETWAHSEGKNARIIALCLHHTVDSKYNGAYDRDKSLDAKRQLLQEWADFCYSKVNA